METNESRSSSAEQGLKKTYRVRASAQIEVVIKVDACSSEQAAAMAEAWTHCSTGTGLFDGYYDHHLDRPVDQRFDLDWEIYDVFQCDAESVELIEDKRDAASKEGEA